MNNETYDLKSSLPNKLIQDDGSITDITGKVISTSVKEYDDKPALPNKFMNADGTYSTLNEIIASMIDVDIFIIVDALPETGKANKIYLVSNKKGSFDEYYYENSKWDKIGEIDMSNLATTEQVTKALNDSKVYTDNMIQQSITNMLGGEY